MFKVCKFKINFKVNVTCLDLSNLKLVKLDGIESLLNLCCLNLAKNKLILLKKIKLLKNLVYLNVSDNSLVKIDELPESLSELILSRNNIVNLSFCANLEVIFLICIKKNILFFLYNKKRRPYKNFF